MRFGITARPNVKEGVKLAQEALNFLEESGNQVLVETPLSKKIGGEHAEIEEMDVHVMVAIGGDGTVLRALQKNDAPVFSINAGSLGFLTAARPDEMIFAFERILRGEYIIDERIKLKIEMNGQRLSDATNEVVVHTSQIAKIRDFQLFIDGELVDTIRADGMIFATPTGSTCYAMSVGSPILFPGLKAFVIVPIAPFKLSSRALVISSESVMEVRLNEARKNCVVVVDGQETEKMTPHDVFTVSLSEKKARFIRFGQDFYRNIKEKLGV